MTIDLNEVYFTDIGYVFIPGAADAEQWFTKHLPTLLENREAVATLKAQHEATLKILKEAFDVETNSLADTATKLERQLAMTIKAHDLTGAMVNGQTVSHSGESVICSEVRQLKMAA